VEVVVGLALLLVVLGSGFGAYMMGIEFNESARNTLRATQFAESKMEEMRTRNWTDLSNMPSISIFYPDVEFSPNHMRQFIGVLIIDPMYKSDGTLVPEQKRIRSWVLWPSGKKNNYYTSAFFESVFTKDGLNDYFVRAF